MFAGLLAWIAQPEVSFSIYGERGVIDILAWHAGPRALLLIEIKTDIVDVNELLGTLDRKRRLARQVAAERGWNALEVGVWLVVAEGTTNRRRVEAHRSVLRSVLPDDGFRVRTWLRDPVGVLAALSFWGPSFGRVPRAGRGQTAGSLPDSQMTNARRPLPPSRRVRRSSATDPERGQAASTHGQAASTPGQAADQGSRPA